MVPSSLLFVAVICLLNMRLASAAVWPTKPVQGTKYTVGKCGMIEWKNTPNAPQCEGPVVIDLHVANGPYLATVGEYDLSDKKAEFCPPDDLHYRGSKYVFLFYCNNSPKPVYTHDFTIRGTTPFSKYSAAFANNTEAMSPGSTSISTSSTTTLSQFSQPASSSTSSPFLASTTSTVSADSFDDNRRNYNSARKNGIDMEKLKFRLVFIAWPALVGISMAL
ncbi:hypothetical protein K435DRAFT_836743 [Dendrothele bispora CBS 962.96]|uniref:Uncharacterized protein n=1 Tax=Dendrothele bispora (strain CBS 962.96) TaxID=1314807 RepID=A0A4S8MGP7_DENBC|nr:hypothetical protein K435DRAFT_836743 [Dendrothele bispora CBS 962.96]